MTMRFIPLAVAAVLALPLAAQSSLGSYDYVSPYTVRISSSDSDAGSRTFSDVANVYGPQVARLLATPANQLPTPVQKVPGKVLFSFLREWDGQPGIANAIGKDAAVGTFSATISLNIPVAAGPHQPATQPGETLTLGNATPVEWELYAENGVIITEGQGLIYANKQVENTANSH